MIGKDVGTLCRVWQQLIVDNLIKKQNTHNSHIPVEFRSMSSERVIIGINYEV